MVSSRGKWFTGGVAWALACGSIVAVAVAAPDPGVAGSYALTGAQGSHADRVSLVVREDGSVHRTATYTQDGSVHEYEGQGSRDGTTLRVTFGQAAVGAGAASGAEGARDLAGTWTLSGKNGVGAYGGTCEIEKTASGYRARLSYSYESDHTDGTAVFDGQLSGRTLSGRRLRTTGLSDLITGAKKRRSVAASYTLSPDGNTLSGHYAGFTETFTRAAGAASPAAGASITAVYTFDADGHVHGTLESPPGANDWTTADESGSRSDAANVGATGELRVVSPASGGAVLVGQVLPVLVAPEGASFDVVSGPARRTATGKLQVTGTGAVVIAAKKGDARSAPVSLQAVGLEVTELTVVGSQPIDDAPAPHMSRAFGSQAAAAQNPAAILLGERLRVSANVRASADLAAPAHVTLHAASGRTTLSGTADLAGLAQGQTVELVSTGALNDVIDVNALELQWTLESEQGIVAAGAPSTPLRVYTVFRAARRNDLGQAAAQHGLATKLHYELACAWARGASQNVGNGATSVGWKLDNMVRHHVHPTDFRAAHVAFPFVMDYAANSPTPRNYADLDGADSARATGERGVSQLYYPPLEVKKPYEDYSNYEYNFGWWLLDNPDYTGGRCNEQASLIADLCGLMGIKAEVHYIQRVGLGKDSGRPVRQYFRSVGEKEYWNFHGLCRVQLDDGTWWLYDGSFSFAPDRKNGTQAWAEAPGGPFVGNFGPWYYEDGGGRVPTSDIPSTWKGVPRAPGEDVTVAPD